MLKHAVKAGRDVRQVKETTVNRMNYFGVLVMVVAWSIAAANPGIALAKDENSGFLADYSQLKEVQDSQGRPYRIWASPKLTPENYHAVILDPIVYYPEPRPSEKVSAQVLREILAYANDALKRLTTKRGVNIVDRPGPGVIKVRVAFTSVAAKEEGLAPYQYLPIALIATMASRAATGTPERPLIVVETEARDSVTGELLGLKVRVGTGERLAEVKEQKVITFQAVKPLIDELAEHAYEEAVKYVKTK